MRNQFNKKLRNGRNKKKKSYGNQLPSRLFDKEEYRLLEKLEIEDSRLIQKHLGYA